MANSSFSSSYFRDRAEQAFRLARQSTDQMLIRSLTELAQEYLARAEALDDTMLGKDRSEDDT
jgi:hypothetical protein